jgi:hypothetical protein
MIPRDGNGAAIQGRLTEATAAGETLEVILVLRGRVRPAPGAGRWRLKLHDGRVLTFAADAVVAVTPVARAARR